MLRKLILFTIAAILLAGCGAAPSSETPANQDQQVHDGARGTGPTGFAAETTAEAAEMQIPEAVPSTAEYFSFTSTSSNMTDENGLTMLYENQCIPTFTSSDASRTVWVSEILDNIARDFQTDSRNLYEYALESVELNGAEQFYSYSNYQQIGAARHDENIVSLISLSSLYSGGTHPNSVQTAYNLDIANRRVLRLEDVIVEGAAPELAKLVRSGVDSKFALIDDGNGLFSDYGDTIDTSMAYGNMTPYWYMNDTGLVIFYNQYELGPYAAGIIKVELPYDALDGILLEEFQPVVRDGACGDLRLIGDSSGCNLIPITIEKDGQSLLVGVEGRVYQVQLSEILWLEDTPIAQNLIFSALSLEQNDVLQITGGYTDESRSFAIEFTNGMGQQEIYYIHDGELSGEP